jgi:hypothetical protein
MCGATRDCIDAMAAPGTPGFHPRRRLHRISSHLSRTCSTLDVSSACTTTSDSCIGPPRTSQQGEVQVAKIDWALLAARSPIILRGDERTAYRDPTAVYHDGIMRLFFTLVRTEPSGECYSYVATICSADGMLSWTEPAILTPRDQRLNMGSPGNIVWDAQPGEWVMCLQTYPRPSGEKFGNQDSRLFTMRSSDLVTWAPPELIRVKGESVAEEHMGRMIDPYLLQDKDEPGTWFCFFKQNGVSVSVSTTGLRGPWEFVGSAESGENVCCLVDRAQGEYVLFHSPANGVGIKRSRDPRSGWSEDVALLTLGQDRRAPASPGQDTTGWAWPWSAGRLTAGFVLPLDDTTNGGGANTTAGIGLQSQGTGLLFFHASDYAEADERGGFDTFASVAVAWSDDPHWLQWHWGTGTHDYQQCDTGQK